MYRVIVGLNVILLLFSHSLALLYCYNQPCPVNSEKCDRDFKIINSSNAEVKINCLDEKGEVLKTYVLYKSVTIKQVKVKDDYFEDDVVDVDNDEPAM